jgi:type II secretory pathway component PulK
MDPKPDLCKYITFHGEGRININTAPLFVLRALSPDVTEEMALKMDTFRRNRGNDLSDATWYKQIIGMSNVTINPQLTTTKSDTFMIVSTGVSGPMNKSIVAVVRRNPDKKSIKLLSWKVE